MIASPPKPYTGNWPDIHARRMERRDAGVCINSGPQSVIVHGEVVQAGRCQRCLDVKRRTH